MDKETRVEIRQRRRSYLLKDKSILSKERELCKLRNIAYDSYEWVDVSPPVFNGYHRYLVVRADLAKTKEGKRLQELIEIVGPHQYSFDKKFLVYEYGDGFTWANTYSGRLYSGKHKKGQKKIEAPMVLRALTEDQYEKLPEHLKAYFLKTRRAYPGWNIREYYVYVCKEPIWKFSKKIVPKYITCRKVYAEGVQSNYDRLYQEFQSQRLWPKWYKAKSRIYNNNDRDWNDPKFLMLKQIGKKDIIDGIKDFYDFY